MIQENKANNTFNSNDMNYNHFIFEYTPRYIHPYILLMRIDRPIGTWLVFIPALQAIVMSWGYQENIDPILQIKNIIIFLVGSFLTRSAGCVINDICDRNIDRNVERTKNRPLASGEITLYQSMLCLLLLITLSCILLIFLPKYTLLWAFAGAILTSIYPLTKRWISCPQVFLGITINWGIMVGWFVSAPDESWGPAIMLYMSNAFLTLGYDTAYAYQDIKDDENLPIGSLSKLTKNRPKFWLSLFYFIHLAIFFTLMLILFRNSLIWVTSYMLATGYVFYGINKLNVQNSKECLAFFKSNLSLMIIHTLSLYLAGI